MVRRVAQTGPLRAFVGPFLLLTSGDLLPKSPELVTRIHMRTSQFAIDSIDNIPSGRLAAAEARAPKFISARPNLPLTGFETALWQDPISCIP